METKDNTVDDNTVDEIDRVETEAPVDAKPSSSSSRTKTPRTAHNQSEDGIYKARSSQVVPSNLRSVAVSLERLFELDKLSPERAPEARRLFDELVRLCDRRFNFHYSRDFQYNPVRQIVRAILNEDDRLMYQDFERLDQIITDAEPLTSFDLFAPPKGRDWLISGWLPAGRLGLLTGIGGIGKSKLALQLAYAVATGTQWLGESACMSETSKSGAVVYASYEDEADEIRRRLVVTHLHRQQQAARSKSISGDEDTTPLPEFENVRFHGFIMRGHGQIWGPKSQTGHILGNAGITNTGVKLREACQKVDARLLIIDNVAGAYGSDMNTLPLVRSFISDWDDWGERNDCAILLIGHPPKTYGVAHSGSADWFNGARYVWEMDSVPSRDDKGKVAVRLQMLKNNYQEIQRNIWLHFNRNFWQEAGALNQKNSPHYTAR